MKFSLIILSFLLSVLAWGKDFSLVGAEAEYTVKHLVKTVKGQSQELKGKMKCENSTCEFLVAIPVKSFVSSDSNRDLNIQTILEATKYPLITVKGKLPEADLSQNKFSFKALVSFHGVEKEYLITANKGQVSKGSLTLLLEEHKVERPSLLTVSIDNEVPVDFSFNWKE